MKQLSLLLESSTEPMIHNTPEYFLKLPYEVFDTSPKRHIVACAMFNTFVDTFRKKLLMLLDDMEQFFLWVVAARGVPRPKIPRTRKDKNVYLK